jgi:16S rRNA (guanine966-N2)-methyltransferase
MRIIAGTHRGRLLLAPAGQATRPITDRAKQSLFDILAPLLEGAVVYDCFAGTGSMGLECLSRGAKAAVFFESDRSAVSLLRKNIAALGLGAQSTVVDSDIFRWFAAEHDAPLAGRIGLIFLDPPYRFLRERGEELQALARKMVDRHLQAEGAIVFRHDAADALPLPGLEPYDVRSYGSMMLEWLRRSSERAAASSASAAGSQQS